MIKHIKDVSTLEELKKVYKRLALKFHPDMPEGDEEIMKEINNEYDELFEKLKNTHKDKDDQFYYKETEETPNEWRDIIYQLMALKMDEEKVKIEVIGAFLWVSGDTFPYKDQLGKKGIGMKWSKNKKSWYLAPKGYRRFGKKRYELNDIREMYGTQTIKAKENEKQEKKKALIN